MVTERIPDGKEGPVPGPRGRDSGALRSDPAGPGWLDGSEVASERGQGQRQATLGPSHRASSLEPIPGVQEAI